MTSLTCVPTRAKKLKDLLKKIEQASKVADVVELWLGDLEPGELDFDRIFAIKTKPYLLNVKGPKEQGEFRGTNEEKVKILIEGAKRGAEYCDLDYKFPERLITRFIQEKGKTDLILSAHFFEHTPSYELLLDVTKQMQQNGADILKIAVMAKNHQDLIVLLRLTAHLREQKIPFITIAMGPEGRLSRILTPLMGGEMMFCSLSAEEKTAEGQLTIDEWRAISAGQKS